MVIINKSANDASLVMELKASLLRAREISEQLSRQVTAATDAEITEIQGIPADKITAWEATLADILAALQSSPIELLLGNIA